MDMTGALADLIKGFIAFVPNLLGAIIVIFVGYVIARIIRKILNKLLKKAKIDVLGEKLNSIEIVDKANIKLVLSDIFSRLSYYILMLFVWVAATDVLGLEAISKLVTDIFNFIPNLLVAFTILIFGLLLADMIRKAVETACDSLGIPSAKLIATLVFYFIFINILISALSQAKINVQFLSQNISVIIGGAVLAFAIGYGLASKDIFSNILASFYNKNIFEIGDLVKIDGVEGEVVEISRTTITLLSDNKKIIIPFSSAMKNKIEKNI